MIDSFYKASRFWLLILVLLWGVSCNCTTLRNLSSLEKPVVTLEQIRLTDLNFDTLTLSVELGIENPNALTVNLASLEYDLILDGISFLKGIQDKSMQISARGRSSLEIPIALEFRNIYQSYQKFKSRDSTQYQLSMGLGFDIPVLGEVKIPLNHEGYIPLLQVPTLQVESLQIGKLGLSSAELLLHLNLFNPNYLQFMMKAMTYDFEVNGKTLIRGTSNDPQVIESKQDNLLVIPISLNFLEMGEAAYQMLTGQSSLSYRLSGLFQLDGKTALLKNLRVSFNKNGDLSIQR